jgi:tetratricopeptide (TPR) repeat protein
MSISPLGHATLDGVSISLPGAGWPSESWDLILPPGKHFVKAETTGEASIRLINKGFMEFYTASAAKHRNKEGFNYEKLVAASRSVLGVYREPLLPHFWGNYFWEQNQPDAAIRYWKWSIRIKPTFAPAHLNLAYAYHKQGALEKARHELILASGLNFQDGFGIAEHLQELRTSLQQPDFDIAATLNYDPIDYALLNESLSDNESRTISAINMIGILSERNRSKARTLNNIGAYLLQRVDKPQWALDYFFRACDSLVVHGEVEADRECRMMVLANIVESMKRLDMVEGKIYSDLAGKGKPIVP